MPKAITGSVKVGSQEFRASVMPDPFDARDLEYRPRLQPLPNELDRRAQKMVLTQVGSSCTGHAVAAMINALLVDPTKAVSPYMLYYLGRRYDEFQGEDDEGSSLRGVLKGWWRHGVCLAGEWIRLDTHHDLHDEKLIASCRERPLGAFYRVNAKRLDDMQSAINELGSIVASAQVHDGWLHENLVQTTRADGKLAFIIRRTSDSEPLGGHAFALVGYDRTGFLVQNSWGPGWGKGGFATLAYEDWLESGYDAWVARPGVPHTPFERVDHAVTERGTVSITSTANVEELRRSHVVNLGNDGHLSTNGKVTSSPDQLDGVVAAFKASGLKDLMVFVHGGLVSESDGLAIASKQYQCWLNHGVYPVFMVWQSGPMETAIDQLADLWHKLPFGAGLDLTEHVDRFIEKQARTKLPWAWAQMKQNALDASKPLPVAGDWRQHPGASMFAKRLADANVAGLRVHLAGHSTGAVFHAGFAKALARVGITKIESLAFLAGAITVDLFRKELLPRLQSGDIARFTNFVMSDQRELDDSCRISSFRIYNKSLLYLVARGFETGASEVPLMGMSRFVKPGDVPGDLIVAPRLNPANSRSDAKSHGSFDEDIPTMTSVLMRVLGRTDVKFQLNAPKAAAQPPAGVVLTSKGRTKAAASAMVGKAPSLPVGVVLASGTERRERPRPSAKAKPAARAGVKRKGK